MMYQDVVLAKKSEKVSNIWTRSLRVTPGKLPQALPVPAWGLDPGINFGLTAIEGDKIFVFHGTLNRDEKPGRMGLIAFEFLQDIIDTFEHDGALMTIEGASYGDPYGQVLLSEVRTGFYLAAAKHSKIAEVTIAAPKSVRKIVFGNGEMRAADEWPLLNKNAADSLAMALHAAEYAAALW